MAGDVTFGVPPLRSNVKEPSPPMVLFCTVTTARFVLVAKQSIASPDASSMDAAAPMVNGSFAPLR